MNVIFICFILSEISGLGCRVPRVATGFRSPNGETRRAPNSVSRFPKTPYRTAHGTQTKPKTKNQKFNWLLVDDDKSSLFSFINL
jgi:hypothetical protein